MNEETDSIYDNIKSYLNKIVNTNVSLSTLGISPDGFKDEAKSELISRINDIASERLENTEIE
jgi:hypothetical protein